MLTVETAVFDCICWFSSSRDRKGQSSPVEYYLESVEEYSEGKIRKSEPEPRNGNVNTVPAPKKRPMISGSKIESVDFYLPSRGYRMLFKTEFLLF